MRTEIGTRPLPHPSEISRPFWDACRDGRLIVQECERCKVRFFVPEIACPACFSFEWRWVDSPGTGKIDSFSIVHRPADPSIPTPYVLATVDLDDGWTMMTNIIDCAPESLRFDQRVQVKFVKMSEDISLPFFTPLESTTDMTIDPGHAR